MEESSPFHTWLKQHRCAQGRTQAALATQLGYSLIMVKKLEAGAARPSRELAEKLAAQFDVPVAVRPAFVAWARGLPAAGANLPATPWTGLRPSCALPVPTTALVGRDSEVARLCALLRERPKRLLTLTGPPWRR